MHFDRPITERYKGVHASAPSQVQVLFYLSYQTEKAPILRWMLSVWLRRQDLTVCRALRLAYCRLDDRYPYGRSTRLRLSEAKMHYQCILTALSQKDTRAFTLRLLLRLKSCQLLK